MVKNGRGVKGEDREFRSHFRSRVARAHIQNATFARSVTSRHFAFEAHHLLFICCFSLKIFPAYQSQSDTAYHLRRHFHQGRAEHRTSQTAATRFTREETREAAVTRSTWQTPLFTRVPLKSFLNYVSTASPLDNHPPTTSLRPPIPPHHFQHAA